MCDVWFLCTWGPDILLVITVAWQFVEKEIVQTVLSDVTLYGDDVRLQGLDQQQDLVCGRETLLQGGVHLETSEVQVEWRHLSTSVSHAVCAGSEAPHVSLCSIIYLQYWWSVIRLIIRVYHQQNTINICRSFQSISLQYHTTLYTIKTITQRVHRSQAVQIRSRFIQGIYYGQGKTMSGVSIYLLLYVRVLVVTFGSSVNASVMRNCFCR